jgi:hypothetical protein
MATAKSSRPSMTAAVLAVLLMTASCTSEVRSRLNEVERDQDLFLVAREPSGYAPDEIPIWCASGPDVHFRELYVVTDEIAAHGIPVGIYSNLGDAFVTVPIEDCDAALKFFRNAKFSVAQWARRRCH